MDDFRKATVVFRQAIDIGPVRFVKDVADLQVRTDGAWVLVRSGDNPTRAYSFPASVIACVAWESES